MRLYLCVFLILTCTSLSGCAVSRQPVLYPNYHLKNVGQQQMEADISGCMQAAEASGANAGKSKEIAKKTASAGAIGGATGAIVGGPIGGATAATAALLGGAIRSSEPTQVYRRYVDQCLRDKGYQPIGWQ